MTARTHSKIIPGTSLSQVAEWDFSQLESASSRYQAKLRAQEHEQALQTQDLLRQQGYEKGYADGYEQGLQDGEQKLQSYMAEQGREAALQLASLLKTAQLQLQESEQVIAQGVLDLACDLARQLLRQELATNPNAILPVVRESVEMVLAEGAIVSVRMHPQDAEVLGPVVEEEFASNKLRVVADASVIPGGCMVESAGSMVDASVEKRWQRLVASLGSDKAWDQGEASEH